MQRSRQTSKKGGSRKSKPKPTNVGSGARSVTVEDIYKNTLTPLANQYWAGPAVKPFDAKIIVDIYQELANEQDAQAKITVLEASSYLENYLWKHFNARTSSFEHIMSMIILVNEKFRHDVINIWGLSF